MNLELKQELEAAQFPFPENHTCTSCMRIGLLKACVKLTKGTSLVITPTHVGWKVCSSYAYVDGSGKDELEALAQFWLANRGKNVSI